MRRPGLRPAPQIMNEQPKPPPTDEADRIAADLHYNRMKNDGTLSRREADRAMAEEIRRGIHD